MAREVRAALKDLVVQHGQVLACDSRRCRAWLMDTCPEHKKQVHALVQVIQKGIIGEAVEAGDIGDIDVWVRRGVSRLGDDTGMSRGLARWAMEAWAMALDLGKPSKTIGKSRSVSAKDKIGANAMRGCLERAFAPPFQPEFPWSEEDAGELYEREDWVTLAHHRAFLESCTRADVSRKIELLYTLNQVGPTPDVKSAIRNVLRALAPLGYPAVRVLRESTVSQQSDGGLVIIGSGQLNYILNKAGIRFQDVVEGGAVVVTYYIDAVVVKDVVAVQRDGFTSEAVLITQLPIVPERLLREDEPLWGEYVNSLAGMPPDLDVEAEEGTLWWDDSVLERHENQEVALIADKYRELLKRDADRVPVQSMSAIESRRSHGSEGEDEEVSLPPSTGDVMDLFHRKDYIGLSHHLEFLRHLSPGARVTKRKLINHLENNRDKYPAGHADSAIRNLRRALGEIP